MAASQLSPVAPGDIVAGRYRVERIIGVGGMGVVLAARHLSLDHLVAIKFLLPKLAENNDIVGRFTREARAAVKIQNEHVARVTDVGTLDIGVPYMVMEYLDGTDLEDHSRKSGPLSIEESVDFVLQTCEAIAEAHGLGIVHRDLKPGNLFLVRRPDGSRIIKVLDFGISKVTGSQGTNPVAPTNTMLGSPPYMSPEQLSRPTEVDARTDVWALGVILYRFLTGRVPFDAATIVQLCAVIMHGDPVSLRSTRADVPPSLERVVLRCLQKEPARRYANVGELASDLLEFAPDRSRVSVERVLHLTAAQTGTAVTIPAKGGRPSNPPDVSFTPAIETRSSWGKTARRGKQRSRRGALVFVGFALVGGGALVAYRFGPILRTAHEPPSSNPESSSPASLNAPPSPLRAPPPVQSAPTASTHADSPQSPAAVEIAAPPHAPPSAVVLPPSGVKSAPRPAHVSPARPAPPRIGGESSGNWEEQRK